MSHKFQLQSLSVVYNMYNPLELIHSSSFLQGFLCLFPISYSTQLMYMYVGMYIFATTECCGVVETFLHDNVSIALTSTISHRLSLVHNVSFRFDCQWFVDYYQMDTLFFCSALLCSISVYFISVTVIDFNNISDECEMNTFEDI